ncbi:MAG: response regulator [Maribacter sp.]|nr:response regulator [Maribacter sp.]
MPIRTVVIDDSPLMRISTCLLVKNHPELILVGSYNSPLEAFEKMGELNPELLFLDVEMPGMDGFEFLDELERKIPVIMNSTVPIFAARAFGYDVSGFLMKPMEKDSFASSVSKVIKMQSLSDIKKIYKCKEYLPMAS